MVQGLPAALVVVPLDEREIGHPHGAPLARAIKPEAARQLEPQRAQRLRGDPGLVGDQQEQVAGRSLERGGRAASSCCRRGTLRPASASTAPPLLDIGPHEPARALSLRELDQAGRAPPATARARRH